ncbi:DUF2507 domain-containing protein [Lactobacillus sp. Sy-1]|uniref:DUF2507 domain-containing protein n=1 Tax=Lactobacillus sp. Sy-1 TaxID=2109645 RepID=UPI001C561A1F|nr:DUF2507 domain-containing protein [Lactobacillus sp. Sy-1]MBW1605777.1 DUF2507 domain-containing protein [Lactobacillus sp. Sy-1]
MTKELYQKFITNPKIKNNWPAAFLREDVITDLLGADIHSILYWAGKRMARKYATANQSELTIFFEQSGLGNITINKETESTVEITVDGPIVDARFEANPDADFMFEAGLLAQSIEQQRGLVTEAELDKKKLKKGQVLVSVHIDPKNPTDEFETVKPFSVISDQITEEEEAPEQPASGEAEAETEAPVEKKAKRNQKAKKSKNSK